MVGKSEKGHRAVFSATELPGCRASFIDNKTTYNGLQKKARLRQKRNYTAGGVTVRYAATG